MRTISDLVALAQATPQSMPVIITEPEAQQFEHYNASAEVPFVLMGRPIVVERLSDDEITRLRRAIDDVLSAIDNPGRHPEHHHLVMATHRRQWPVLWDALGALRRARQSP